jgi:hypothetical protein
MMDATDRSDAIVIGAGLAGQMSHGVGSRTARGLPTLRRPEFVSRDCMLPPLDVEDRARAGSCQASNAGQRGSLLGMVRIGELENGDLFVPVPAEFDAEGHVVDGIMCRIAADTDEHAGWMREVEAGRVDGPRS